MEEIKSEVYHELQEDQSEFQQFPRKLELLKQEIYRLLAINGEDGLPHHSFGSLAANSGTPPTRGKNWEHESAIQSSRWGQPRNSGAQVSEIHSVPQGSSLAPPPHPIPMES